MEKKTDEQLRNIVREKYAEIAQNASSNGCCGSGSCGSIDYSVFADDYSGEDGYVEEADLGLGCGLPTEFAGIKAGDTVVDLGSGAGNDVFVARAETGDSGRVIGLDMTEAMIERANANAVKLGYQNVAFILGEIENMPLEDGIADVVVSNCVLNLVPDKVKAFSETWRILKKGGHFSISDVVIKGNIPDALRKEAELYAGCVTGAIEKEEYLLIIEQVGFKNIVVQKEKEVVLPDELLEQYLTEAQKEELKTSGLGIYSITVYAEK